MARGSKPVAILDADGKVRRWTAVVDVAPDPATGKRRQKRLSARTKKALEAKIADTLGEVHRGAYVAPSTETLATYLPRWLATHATGVRPASALQYDAILRARLLPGLGAVPLARLTPLAIQAHYAALADAGYAATSIREAHMLLRRALAQAVAWGLLPRNPTDGVRPPAAQATARRVWSADEARRFLAATAADRDAPLWRLALETGARIGELLALRWADVDPDAARLAIARTLTKTRDGAWTIGETTKTKGGRRTVALLPTSVAALRAQRRAALAARVAAGPGWAEHDLVFPAPAGGPRNPDRVRQRFMAAVAAAGVPRLTLHGLRHTHATLLLAAGAHPKVVSDRLGHRTVALTLDRYTHPDATLQHAAAAALADLLAAPRDAPVTRREAT